MVTTTVLKERNLLIPESSISCWMQDVNTPTATRSTISTIRRLLVLSAQVMKNIPAPAWYSLMSNDEAGSKTMSLGKEHQGEVWHEITGSIPEEVTLDEEGNGEFSVAARNIAVWIKK